jgi:signal peptidase II
LLEGARVILMVISFIALFVVFFVFFFAGSKNRLLYAVLGLLAAGICGNLFDRLFNSGQVRDFIEVVYWPGLKPWPAFNVADSLLCIAVAVVLIMTFIQRPSEKHARKHK